MRLNSVFFFLKNEDNSSKENHLKFVEGIPCNNADNAFIVK